MDIFPKNKKVLKFGKFKVLTNYMQYLCQFQTDGQSSDPIRVSFFSPARYGTLKSKHLQFYFKRFT